MRTDSAKILTDVVQNLSLATDIETVTSLVAAAAREISGADGATFVLRDQDSCYYANEDAISPLWKGGRFPISNCISGWAMLNKSHVIIPDVYQDSRIPHAAYKPTFVKSLCMVPIRTEKPIGAIGNYWADGYIPNADEVKLLQALANSTSIALNNLELRQSLLKSHGVRNSLEDRKVELETAIHTLVHDLNNPLATIMLLTELLEDKLDSQMVGEVSEYVSSLKTSGKQMRDQIQRMLSLYGITRRKLQREEISLTVMAEDIAEDLLRKYPERKINFEIGRGMAVHADRVLMHVALENILNNSVKYTGKKESALIQFQNLGTVDRLTTFCVKDNGDGFESDLADRLFRPMVRLHKEQEFKGTGLGLASVARIIEMHGGTIQAKGEKSVGATFLFSLP